MSALTRSQTIYRKLAVISFITVLFLICIGATVRITGAGMGCPDWPTCYGKIVPPSDASQIDASKYNVAGFNPVLTWIEYVNRLCGAATGIIAFLAAVFSLSWRKKDRLIPFIAIAALILVGYAGWLGAKVVQSNLHAGTVTIHMLVALGVLFLNLFALARVNRQRSANEEVHGISKVGGLAILALAVLVAQIVIGTLVRGEVEAIANTMGTEARASWLSHANEYFPLHKITSLGIMIVTAYLLVKLFQIQNAPGGLKMARVTILLSAFGQVMTGLLLDSFGFPAVGQLLHLVFAVLMFSGIVYTVCLGLLSGAKAEASTKEIIYA
jgi:cytochrome c oxidase assembly protein subunit 15